MKIFIKASVFVGLIAILLLAVFFVSAFVTRRDKQLATPAESSLYLLDDISISVSINEKRVMHFNVREKLESVSEKTKGGNISTLDIKFFHFIAGKKISVVPSGFSIPIKSEINHVDINGVVSYYKNTSAEFQATLHPDGGPVFALIEVERGSLVVSFQKQFETK